MERPRFVDCHSHVVPSGDDGAQNVREGLDLCRSAAAHGTGVLFATPHVWPHLPLSPEREQEIRAAHAELAGACELDLRLGFELTPHRRLLDEDPTRYELRGTRAVLVEIPFAGPASAFVKVAEHVEAAGLRVIVGHPERTEAVHARPSLVDELAERGWLVQVNASSLTGYHGPAIQELGWDFLGRGLASLVASDGHRTTRPPFLDDAYALAVERLGVEATRFFDGSALLGEPHQQTRAA
jgi:protein-tyrosine phosphatase